MITKLKFDDERRKPRTMEAYLAEIQRAIATIGDGIAIGMRVVRINHQRALLETFINSLTEITDDLKRRLAECDQE
jgi:hypothetical protein